METLLKYLPLFTFIAGLLVSPLLTKWTISSRYDIALKSGLFDKPKAEVYFANKKLLSHSGTRIVYGANFEDQVPIIASLPLQIVNEGNKTLRNGSITIRYPQNNMMLSEAELPLKGAGILDENIPKRTTSELPQFKFASWFIKDLNPKILFGIGESFRLNETTQIRTFRDYKTNKWMREKIEYTLSLLVTVSAEDIEAQDYMLLFKSIKSSDIDDLINKYYAKVNNQSQRARKSMSFIDYLILYFQQPVEDATFIYITKDNKVYQKVVSRYRFPLTF